MLATRRRFVRWSLALLIAASVLPLGRAYQALCSEPIDTYTALAAARDAARAEAARAEEETLASASAGPSPNPAGALLARTRAALLEALLRVKQSDPVAFTSHTLAGFALEVGRCPVRSSADQWRKAAAHAASERSAALAAAGLARTADQLFTREGVVAWLERYAADEPWHASNLVRVLSAYRELQQPPAARSTQ
jgi:hypothetical protein